MVSELQNKGLHINAAALPILGKMLLGGGSVQQGVLWNSLRWIGTE